MLELRILNGEKKGLAVPLLKDNLIIGTEPSCAIMLSNSNSQGQNAIVDIRLAESGKVQLKPVKGAVIDHKNINIHSLIDLTDQTPFNIQGTWLVAQQCTLPWPTRLPKIPVSHEITRPSNTDGAAKFIRPKTRKRWLTHFKALLASSSLFAVGTIAHTTVPDILSNLDTPNNNTIHSVVTNANNQNQGSINGYKERLIKMLSDREITGVTINSVDNVFLINGTLNQTQLSRYRRMLERISKEISDITIKDHVSQELQNIPFEIHAVVAGKTGSITTHSGTKVSINETYMGYRLDNISNTEISFSGKNDITIAW